MRNPTYATSLRSGEASRLLLLAANSFSIRYPILDAGCGTGRNAIALAKRKFTVVCADRDWSRVEALRAAALSHKLSRRLAPVWTELKPTFWPFGPACFSAIVLVHYLDVDLLPLMRMSLVTGGHLYCETVGGHGQNHLELPRAGELFKRLSPWFRFSFYDEHAVGPARVHKCSVRFLARKLK